MQALTLETDHKNCLFINYKLLKCIIIIWQFVSWVRSDVYKKGRLARHYCFMYNRSTQRYNVMYHYINKIFDSTVYFAEGVLSTVHNYDLSYRKLVEWMGGA